MSEVLLGIWPPTGNDNGVPWGASVVVGPEAQRLARWLVELVRLEGAFVAVIPTKGR